MGDSGLLIEEDLIEDEVLEGNIQSPFATKDIKITNAVISLSSIINRLEHNEIDLNPDFQRNANLWTIKQMSRLIESIILKLPLPVFYFDVTDPDKWLVVDGLQRLSTLKKFIVDNKDNVKSLKLNHMEFLTSLNGSLYSDLGRNLKRVIDETQIVTYQIEAQTPKKVRYAIFNRINTGGVSLNAQEIRQALNQKNNGVKFLEDVCTSKTFREIVGVKTGRMLDRELALRFVAFKFTNYNDFNVNHISEFLDEAMEKLDDITDEDILSDLRDNLLDTLKFTVDILGKNHGFSRSFADNSRTKTINRSLFDVVTHCFSVITDKDKFFRNKKIFIERFSKILKNDKSDFSRAITEGTSSKGAIKSRFCILTNLINEVINED